MIKEERELSIICLKGIMEKYVDGEGGIRSPLPEYYAIECAIRALEQETTFDKINDSRFIILKPSKNIKQVLETDGYPFKSKYHSHVVDIWQNRGIENSESVKNYLVLQTPKSGIILTGSHVCPQILKYQFYEGAPFKISSKCCNRLKKEPMHKFSIENNRPFLLLVLCAMKVGKEKLQNALFSLVIN